MKQDDFEYVDDVHNYLDLIESMFMWREDDYKELVKYITQRSLLVNGQGLVIAELLLKSGPDHGQKKINGPLYMWSLHIIALDTYIDHYMVRPIPFRPIQFLDDKKGPGRGDVPVELSPSEHKLTRELEKEKNDKEAADKQVTELKETNKTLKSGKEAADKQIMELQGQIETLKRNEPWEKDVVITDTDTSNWVGIEDLLYIRPNGVYLMGHQGKFTVEDKTCNIRVSYLHEIEIYWDKFMEDVKAVISTDPPGLTNIKQKARFDKTKWSYLKDAKTGITYAVKTVLPPPHMHNNH